MQTEMKDHHNLSFLVFLQPLTNSLVSYNQAKKCIVQYVSELCVYTVLYALNAYILYVNTILFTLYLYLPYTVYLI